MITKEHAIRIVENYERIELLEQQLEVYPYMVSHPCSGETLLEVSDDVELKMERERVIHRRVAKLTKEIEDITKKYKKK